MRINKIDTEKEVKKRFQSIEDMFDKNEVISLCQCCGKIKYDGHWYKHPIHSGYKNYSPDICPKDYNIWVNFGKD